MRLRLDPVTKKVQEILRSNFFCTYLDVMIHGPNNELFLYMCQTSVAPNSRLGGGRMDQMTSILHNGSIDASSQFRMGKIGFGLNIRFLVTHSVSFLCAKLNLVNHVEYPPAGIHSIVIWYTIDLASLAENYQLHSYMQVPNSNFSYVFGKVDSLWKIWFIEMSSDLESIQFRNLNQALIVPYYNLANFELIDYSQTGEIQPIILG